MRLRSNVLICCVTAGILAAIPGCAPSTTQGDGSPTVEGRDGVSEEAPPNSDTTGSSPASGISVDIGGGEGVDVDVNLPVAEAKEGQAAGEGGIQVDVGDGAVDVQIGSDGGDKK